MQRVRLHQNAFQLDCLQQLPQCLGFTACISGVGGLGNRDAQALGIEADLGNECRCTGAVTARKDDVLLLFKPPSST